MVSDGYNIQIHIDKVVEHSELLNILSSLLSIQLTPLDDLNSEAKGFVMFQEYLCGFPLGVYIAWGQDTAIDLDGIRIIKFIAQYYKTVVATDFPDTIQLESVMTPYFWYVVEPDGQLYQVEGTPGQEETEGLVLNLESKQRLHSLELGFSVTSAPREKTFAQDATFNEAESRIRQALAMNAPRLDLSSLGLNHLPESIGQLIQLRELQLDGNQLSYLPKSIGQLVNLQELHLDGNQLLSLPESIGRFAHLKNCICNVTA